MDERNKAGGDGMAHESKSHDTAESKSQGTGALRGFASMEQGKQREIARKGGANVPHEKRSFAQDRTLAAEAGRKGGRAVKPEHRSFAQNRALAAAAGRKGGQTSQSRRIGVHTDDDDHSGGTSNG
jgi:general stress protein YciG